jgi:hypothetical protein
MKRNFQLKRPGQRTKKTFALNVGPLPQMKHSLQPSGGAKYSSGVIAAQDRSRYREFQLGMNLLAAAKQTQFEEGQVL